MAGGTTPGSPGYHPPPVIDPGSQPPIIVTGILGGTPPAVDPSFNEGSSGSYSGTFHSHVLSYDKSISMKPIIVLGHLTVDERSDTREFPTHTFLVIEGVGYGFWPSSSTFGRHQGSVHNDVNHAFDTQIRFQITQEQYDALMNAIADNATDNYSIINFLGYNCTGWADHVLEQAGIRTSPGTSWMPIPFEMPVTQAPREGYYGKP